MQQMWVLIGIAFVMLTISTIIDLKIRKVSLPVIVIATLLSIPFRIYEGMWEGYAELFLRFLPGILFLIVSLIRKNDLGMGDTILVTSTGYILGAAYIYRVLIVSSIIGGIVSLVLIVVKRRNRQDTIPFSPLLLTGVVVVVVTKALGIEV